MKRRPVLAAIAAAPFITAISTSAQTPTSEQANIDLVRRFYADVLNAMDAEAARDLFADDFVSPDFGSSPGIDGLIDDLASFFSATPATFASLKYEEDAIIADGDTVVFRGRLVGETLDGHHLETSEVTWYQIKDARISAFWGGTDQFDIQLQMSGLQ